MNGLPDSVWVCLIELDGLLTRTAKVHAAARKEMFDEYLREHGASIVVYDLSELLGNR